MRFTCVFAATACLLLAPAAGRAQTNTTRGPQLLPIPAAMSPVNGYPATGDIRPSMAAGYGAQPTGWQRGGAAGLFRPGAGAPPAGGSSVWGEPIGTPPADELWGEPGVPTLANPQGGDLGLGGCPTCGVDGAGPNGVGPYGSPFAGALAAPPIAPIALPGGIIARPGMWFGSLAGMIMTRDNPNKFWTSFNVNNAYDQTLNTQQAAANWAGGGQVMFGRWFGCACNPMYGPVNGVQFVYWGIAPMTGSASIISPTNSWNTPINLGYVNIGPNPATDYFDNAHIHQVTRNDQFQNFEINALRRVAYGPGGLMFTGVAGARYFRFRDSLSFASAAGGHNFGDDGGADEAYYDTSVTNNLMGFQMGGRVDYFVLPRVRLYAQPMFGIFGNHATIYSNVYSGNGLQGNVENVYNTSQTSPFLVQSSKNSAALMGQIDLGAGYQITPRFALFAAYRVMAFSRVALADNQIPAFLVDRAAIQDIQMNGNLVLHGIMMGGMFNY
ncbi:MAG TPA: BBP7 family outer membrane beta-barrel protein [Pirellulales bacterium]|nr:BBP7 family outer membrane beta-barrel protein [Pirellulales bacterium]